MVKFVGLGDAIIYSMGFATNSTIISALAVKGCLIISDEDASIPFGTRLSVGMFKHNDMKSHGALLKEVTSQPKTHRPWKKVVLIVGLYSTEGTSVNLPGSSSLPLFFWLTSFVYHSSTSSSTKPTPLSMPVTRYEFLQYRSVDILMGTFTKSSGAAGEHVAGNKTLIDLRMHAHAGVYAESMTPSVLTQIVSSMVSTLGVAPPNVLNFTTGFGALMQSLTRLIMSWGSWISRDNDDDGCLSFITLWMFHLSRVGQQEGYDRGGMSIGDESKSDEAAVELATIESESAETGHNK